MWNDPDKEEEEVVIEMSTLSSVAASPSQQGFMLMLVTTLKTWTGLGSRGLGWTTWTGLGPCGLGWDHVDWAGTTWTRLGSRGLGWDHMDWAGTTWTGLGPHGLGWDHVDWAGTTWTGLGSRGLGWDHVDWAGTMWTGLSWSMTGLEAAGLCFPGSVQCSVEISDPPLTMLRSATCFLSHLPTPSALARPRTSYLPGLHFRKLRVFARRPNDESHAEVEVKDDASVAALQNAIIVNLKLDMSPNCVRLLREVEGGVPVLLDSCKKLADQGVFEGSKVVVEVTTPQVTSALFALEIRLRMPKGREATKIIKHFTSAPDFRWFLVGRTLYHMRTAKGGDKYITIVTDLDEAVSVSTTAGDFLMLDDPTTLLRDDVSKLKCFSMNVAGGFEELSNKAIAINKDLLKAYGGFLEPLNDGRGVTFYDDVGNAYVQCDGLVKNTEVVLLNEAKMHFHEEDVKELRNVTAMKLNTIKAYPHLFSSDPEDIIEQLKGLKIVLIASGSSFTKKAEEDCEKAGIHRIRQDGSGFSCTLASLTLAS
ncbi:hypothetical protein EMCRGX_G002070 [Ephydatia muelleri]